MRRKRSLSAQKEIIYFNFDSLMSEPNPILVKSAELLLALQESGSSSIDSSVSVAQIVKSDGLITLDTTDITSDEDGEVILKLDISHAVQAWMNDPETNLGLSVSLPSLSIVSSTPELVLTTSHSNVPTHSRKKRDISVLSEIFLNPQFLGRTDCAEEDGDESLWQNGRNKFRKCCR